MFVSRCGFLGQRNEWHYFRFDQIQDGGSAAILENSYSDISATDRAIHFVLVLGWVFEVGGLNGTISHWPRNDFIVGVAKGQLLPKIYK